MQEIFYKFDNSYMYTYDNVQQPIPTLHYCIFGIGMDNSTATQENGHLDFQCSFAMHLKSALKSVACLDYMLFTSDMTENR